MTISEVIKIINNYINSDKDFIIDNYKVDIAYNLEAKDKTMMINVVDLEKLSGEKKYNIFFNSWDEKYNNFTGEYKLYKDTKILEKHLVELR